MEFGIALPNFGTLGRRDDLVEIAQSAEALGYTSLWTTDHVMMARGQEQPYGHILEAVTSLSYVAALTRSARLGISVIVLPQREPVLFAKMMSTLDQLSGGRLVVGLGAGWNAKEFAFLSASFDDRGKRFDEYIRALRELWTSSDPRFEGQYVQFADALFSPRSAQQGGPRITIGGNSPATYRRVATLADGWHPVGLEPAAVTAGRERIEAQAGGREIHYSLRIRTVIDQVIAPTTSASGQVQANLSGSVEQIVARIGEYRQAGVQELVAQFPTDSRSTYIEGMRRFAEEVRPKVAG